MSAAPIIARTITRLYPGGRAYDAMGELVAGDVHDAIAEVIGEAADDVAGLLDHVLPDSDRFTIEDCRLWEQKLGLITNEDIAVADRRAAIAAKWRYPGEEVYRQHAAFVEGQLRTAGFDVRVYENRWDDGAGGYEWRTVAEVLGVAAGNAVLDMHTLDEIELDEEWEDAGVTLAVRHIEEALDADFWPGVSLYATFFVAGDTVTTPADVPTARKEQFRQMLMELKKVEMVGYLLINYTV